MASIPPVSKQLLLKYDSQFNKQLDRMNNLNNEITTKTRMINFNDQMTDQKDKKTIILTNVIWYLVILTVLLFLYLIGSVQLPLFIGMAVVIALIFVFRTYFTHFYRTDVDLSKYFYRKLHKTLLIIWNLIQLTIIHVLRIV